MAPSSRQNSNFEGSKDAFRERDKQTERDGCSYRKTKAKNRDREKNINGGKQRQRQVRIDRRNILINKDRQRRVQTEANRSKDSGKGGG